MTTATTTTTNKASSKAETNGVHKVVLQWSKETKEGGNEFDTRHVSGGGRFVIQKVSSKAFALADGGQEACKGTMVVCKAFANDRVNQEQTAAPVVTPTVTTAPAPAAVAATTTETREELEASLRELPKSELKAKARAMGIDITGMTRGTVREAIIAKVMPSATSTIPSAIAATVATPPVTVEPAKPVTVTTPATPVAVVVSEPAPKQPAAKQESSTQAEVPARYSDAASLIRSASILLRMRGESEANGAFGSVLSDLDRIYKVITNRTMPATTPVTFAPAVTPKPLPPVNNDHYPAVVSEPKPDLTDRSKPAVKETDISTWTTWTSSDDVWLLTRSISKLPGGETVWVLRKAIKGRPIIGETAPSFKALMRQLQTDQGLYATNPEQLKAAVMEGTTCEFTMVTGDKKARRENVVEETEEEVEESDDEGDEEEVEERRPVKKAKKIKKATRKVVESDDEDEDERPAKKGKKGAKPARETETDKWGARLGTQSAKINAAISSQKSKTVEQLEKETKCSNVRNHLRTLVKKGFVKRLNRDGEKVYKAVK